MCGKHNYRRNRISEWGFIMIDNLDFLQKAELGSYVGLTVEADSETAFIDELINMIIDSTTFTFDDELIESELPRIETDLRASLTENKKPVGAYCYVMGIKEEDFTDHVRDLITRTAAENGIIEAIAKSESIVVADSDIKEYMAYYRRQYADALMGDATLSDENLAEAIKTKKVLKFLRENNTWKSTAPAE